MELQEQIKHLEENLKEWLFNIWNGREIGRIIQGEVVVDTMVLRVTQ